MTIQRTYNAHQQRWEFATVPEAVPNASQEVVTADNIHLIELHLVGSGSGTITIVDGNGLNVVAPALPVGTGSGDYLRDFVGRVCPGGLKWQASDASIVGFARWYI